MLLFWIFVAVLTIIALAFVILPLRGSGRSSLPVQADVNREIYRVKLEELQQDLASDLIQQEYFDSARDELARDLLINLAPDDTETEPTQPQSHGTAALSWALVIILPVLAIGIYTQLTTGLQYVDGDQPVAAEQLPFSVDEMIERLAEKLEEDTGDLEGWVMLGRSLMVTQRYHEASRAYLEANKLSENPQPDLKVALAEAMVYANNGEFNDRSIGLIKEALAVQADHQKALWLAGLSTYQRGQYSAALDYWQSLLALIPQDNVELKSALKNQIAQAQQAAHIEIPSPDDAQESQALEQSLSVNDSIDNDTDAAISASIQVKVALSPRFADRVQPEDTVFVYASAVNGPRMPLSLVRKQAKDLPIQVTLDDSTSMIPAFTLSSQSEVKIIARVSSSGQAQAQAGDLIGKLSPVTAGENQTISIIIDDEIK